MYMLCIQGFIYMWRIYLVYMLHIVYIQYVCVCVCKYCMGVVYIPGVVVGAGAQDVTQRVPGQTPDHPFMSHLHPSNLLLHPDTNHSSKHQNQSNQ